MLWRYFENRGSQNLRVSDLKANYSTIQRVFENKGEGEVYRQAWPNAQNIWLLLSKPLLYYLSHTHSSFCASTFSPAANAM